MTRAAVIALVVALALAATGCGNSPSKTSTGSQSRLTNLNSIGRLQTAFQTASGKPRLILLVSPT